MSDLEIPPQEWLDIFERDYLATFVHEGGASTKVLVVEAGLAADLVSTLIAAAERNGLLATHVDQTVQRVYSMDRLFNAVARQINWQSLARDFMRATLQATGYVIPDGDPIVDAVAAANSVDAGEVAITVQQQLTKLVMQDYTIARDFRVAMNQL